jgi:hypothetical protein
MRIAKCSLALMLAIALPGCGHDRSAAPSAAGSTYITQPDRLVLGWFVESDGHGRSGYQAAYADSSSSTPQTVTLYRSMNKFRVALQKYDTTNIDSISGYTNDVWKIRGLTFDELKELR